MSYNYKQIPKKYFSMKGGELFKKIIKREKPFTETGKCWAKLLHSDFNTYQGNLSQILIELFII